MMLWPYIPIGTEFMFTRKLTYTASCAHSNFTSRVFLEKPVITQLLRYSKQGRTVAIGLNIFVSSVWGLFHLTVLAARVFRRLLIFFGKLCTLPKGLQEPTIGPRAEVWRQQFCVNATGEKRDQRSSVCLSVCLSLCLSVYLSVCFYFF